MTRLPDKRVPLTSRLHISKNAIEQFKKNRLHRALICSNTGKEFNLTIEPERMLHIVELPGIFKILFVGRNDIGSGCIRSKSFKDRTRFTKSFGPGAIDHHDKPQHALRKNLPHEVEALLPGCAKQIKYEIIIHGDAAKVHRDRCGVLDGALRGVRDLAFGGDNVNFADRLYKFCLPGTERPRHHHLDCLHTSYPSNSMITAREY